ncbi:hypothetical protein LWI29_016334 [Acer saccharum]|uniref:Uncharacterized protein n=1 Tax=Acer saccharum TaxID=4024 RepID=A0AA39VZ55_ACESA|nr:hypothetical protein LWI29_016334 [Acer saccharum]
MESWDQFMVGYGKDGVESSFVKKSYNMLSHCSIGKGDNACVIKDKGKSDILGKSDSVCAKLDIEKNMILEYGDISESESIDREEGEVSAGMVVLGSNELIGDFVGPYVGIGGEAYDKGDAGIDLYVDLGGLEPFFRNGKVGAIVASSCPSARRGGKKIYFPSRIHRMKTRSRAHGCNFSGLEEELADRIASGKNDDKG